MKCQTFCSLFADRKLCCLHDQLSSKEIQSVLRLLENVGSPSVDCFRILTLQLHEGLERAVSNMIYLNVLMKTCNDLKCTTEIEEHMIKIFFLILFIWTESSFYNESYVGSLISQYYLQLDRELNTIIRILYYII